MSSPSHPQPRVCHLVQDVSYGGVETLLVDLVRETRGEFDHHVCYVSDHSEGAAAVRDAGATVSKVDIPATSPRAAFDPRSVPPVVRHLRGRDADVVHAHFPLYAHVLARVAAACGGAARVVGTYHNQRADFHPVMQGVEWVTRPLADALVGVSERTAAGFADPPTAPGAPDVETIPDGIDVDAFNDRVRGVDPGGARDEWGVDRDALVFLCVGRYAAQKAQDDLVRALDPVLEEGHDAAVLLVGHGPRRAALEAAAEAGGVADRVTVAGPVERERVHRCYAAADAFVLPSTSEGLGIALLEAMAAELPVAATAVTGPSAVVDDGETGYLVPPGRPDRLADAMCRLADPDERARLGRNGLARARGAFDIEDVAESYADLYRP